MPADKRADLGRLEKVLDAPPFSFVRPDLLQEVLALTPGAVTPFGLINETQRRVTVILDQEMLGSKRCGVTTVTAACADSDAAS
jgi:Ala-tRNA(Pro) deacylase